MKEQGGWYRPGYRIVARDWQESPLDSGVKTTLTPDSTAVHEV